MRSRKSFSVTAVVLALALTAMMAVALTSALRLNNAFAGTGHYVSAPSWRR